MSSTRIALRVGVALGGLVLLAACDNAGSSPIAAQPPSGPATSGASQGASPGASPAPGAGGATPELGSTSCPEIVAGITAFNEGDFATTVADFEKAIPLAEAEDDGSTSAGLLVAAVKYYAALAPADYPDAAATSPEFAKYKIVTLSLCASGGGPAPKPSPSGGGGVSI